MKQGYQEVYLVELPLVNSQLGRFAGDRHIQSVPIE